ncbi:MAG: TIGR01777 family oxidoreductase [Bacteroidales bacterium]
MAIKKKVLIIGASGFIGKELQKGLKNYETGTLRGRNIKDFSAEQLSKRLTGYYAIINLAGKSIFTLWTRKNKRKIYDSRINTSNKLAEAVNIMKEPPELFINASAIGIYKPETIVKESNDLYDNGFMARVVKEWEKSLNIIDSKRVGVSVLRIGVVLGKNGGAYKILRKLTRFNLGAYFDKGEQSLSFIWIKDLIRVFNFILDKKITGTINAVSPEPSNYRTLMRIMKKELKAFIIWPVPSLILKIFLGEASEILLNGQKVIPDVLLKNSFNFEASDIDTCIKKLESS